MPADPINPFSSPVHVDDRPFGIAGPSVASRWLSGFLALALIPYTVITGLLLSSTPGDRFYGYFYVPVALLIAALVVGIWRSSRHVATLAFATGLAQFSLGTWLIWLHGFGHPALCFAILPTVVICGLTGGCVGVASFQTQPGRPAIDDLQRVH